MQVQQALHQHFGSQLPVTLANHPAPPLQEKLAQVLMVVQMAALGVVLAGHQAAPFLERVGIVLPPEAWRGMAEKKMALLLGIWFIGNTVRQNLLSTGAFEISYEGHPVWSKLSTGEMPRLADVVDGIAAAMRQGGAQAEG